MRCTTTSESSCTAVARATVAAHARRTTRSIRTKQETTDLAKIPVWDRAKDAASGDDYYFNTRTGEVTWERPDGYISPAEKAVEDERKLPEGDPGAIQEW